MHWLLSSTRCTPCAVSSPISSTTVTSMHTRLVPLSALALQLAECTAVLAPSDASAQSNCPKYSC
eukprot:6207165-Pleurochrysis_carterae.AAC.1